MHIPGVGYSTERNLWRSGIETWEDFQEMMESVNLRPGLVKNITDGIRDSESHLNGRDQKHFANLLPSREYWRAYSDFKSEAAFLDIETTGLDIERSKVTVIGLFDGHKMQSFVRGDNFSSFASKASKYKVLITFNGARFDLPFLRAAFPSMDFKQIHIDLRYPLRRLGFAGGLKAIEKRLGIERSEETTGITGWEAVRLWQAHEKGEDEALETLLKYNAEDVRNLETLMDLSYCTLKTIYLRSGFTSGDEWKESICRKLR